MTTNILNQVAGKIIKEQELIIGSLAWQEAEAVDNLKVIDKKSGLVEIDPSVDNRLVIDELVNRYVTLFGRAAREVCREAAISYISNLADEEIPSSFR